MRDRLNALETRLSSMDDKLDERHQDLMLRISALTAGAQLHALDNQKTLEDVEKRLKELEARTKAILGILVVVATAIGGQVAPTIMKLIVAALGVHT